MFFKSDSALNLVLDGSCSTDPDLSPQTYGPAEQGLSYTFECYRECEPSPVHNASDSLWGFVPWSFPDNPYNKSGLFNASGCPSTNSSYQSNKGCFRPLDFHISGPLTTYHLSNWTKTNYPLGYTDSNTINRVCFFLKRLQIIKKCQKYLRFLI